ncbi:hypothetical protein SAMN05444671_4617 [Flavobacterium sp. CF108]|uniref:hypothetical protein n=1 Tax=unclassified Flavobacterium TaxID=196869 RepID=UPI0008D59E98|nr:MULTISPECIES: hypothetical protein [unclassified Flavobacterium]SEP02174.1 hypothetical protein SAMN04487978_4201 [Flavobacterium sp. fv08]SHH98707.1 hypothetical protein SAMN05444671_4617 [Flavobacterium sp. CF108]
MEKITSKILSLQPVTFIMLFIILPFVSLIVTGIITFIGFFANFEFIFPLVLISVTIVGIVYFIWVWGIVYHINEKEVSDKRYFKISFWILFSYGLIRFILGLEMDITKNPILLENSTWAILEALGSLYTLIVFASYIYVSYFVAKKITLLQNDTRIPEFFYFAAAWCFPIGIPFLQAKLLKKKTIFDIISK